MVLTHVFLVILTTFDPWNILALYIKSPFLTVSIPRMMGDFSPGHSPVRPLEVCYSKMSHISCVDLANMVIFHGKLVVYERVSPDVFVI